MTTIAGVGVAALPRRLMLRQRQRAGEAAERVVDEQAGDVILLEQRLDGLGRQLLVLVRQIDQVRAAIGGDDEIGLGRDPCRARRCRPWDGLVALDRGVLVVGIEQRQVERLGEVERQKAHRQEVLRRVVIADLGRGAGLAFLGDGREAVVGLDHDVGGGGEAELVQRLAELGEVVVGVLDAGHRGRAVDAGHDLC